MGNKTNKSIEISEFLSVIGSEFMKCTGYGVYAFLTYQRIFEFYVQFEKSKDSIKTFARKLVKEHLAT